MGIPEEPYKVLPQWHSQPGHLRVINVGAGAAGLLLAYKMKMSFSNYELVCYEKNPSVGGTWYENRYPGCACDVPAHVYTYSFEPNPNWTTFYAYGPEIRQYFDDFAKKYELHPFVKLNTRVTKCIWVEDKGIYEVEIESGGTVMKDWCHVLVNGTGFLNSWKWPQIPGLHDFQGKLLHSAAWDESVDCKDKIVAVIGTGSSAIQIVPQMQKTAKHLISFMRSVTWVCPPPTATVPTVKDAAVPPEATAEQFAPTENAQYYFTEEEKKRFREDPTLHLEYRRLLERNVNGAFELFLKGSETSKQAEAWMRSEMLKRIGPGNEELKEKLIPQWPPGCRRLTPGDGYLESLVQDNVTTVHAEITKVVSEGLVDEIGKLHKADVLVCATGFNIAFAPPFEVRGVDGVTMAEEFSDEPKVYLAVTVPKFPNYFVVNGVRGNWGAGSALPSHEVQVEYILKCVSRIQAERIRAFEVKIAPVLMLYEHIDTWHDFGVWTSDCKSWYKLNIIGGKVWLWGGSALHYMKTVKEVKYEHYDFRYHDRNIWTYLGNGRIEAEITRDPAGIVPYIRSSDTPWSL